MTRMLYTAALLMLGASVAGAQITTYLAPPRRDQPSSQTIAAADSARRDSAQVAITNMKAWVDSASGISVPATVGAIDSAALANDPGRPVTTTFTDGSAAPATASDLPTFAAIGALALLLGSILLANRPRI